MSAEQLPCIQKLKQEQEVFSQDIQKESYQSREKYRQSEGGRSNHKTAEKREQSDEKPSSVIKVVIDEDKLLTTRPSIFAAQKENSSKGNIFANSKSVNLFNHPKSTQQNGGINIFTLPASSQPLISNDPEDDLLSHSSEANEISNQEYSSEPAQKVMKYKYEEQTNKLAEFRLNRFKNDGEPTKENVHISLEEKKDGKKDLILLLVRNQITKIIFYQAWLIPTAPVDNFMNKQENLRTSVVRIKTTEEGIKHQRENVKMQFQNQEEALMFKKVLEDFLHLDQEAHQKEPEQEEQKDVPQQGEQKDVPKDEMEVPKQGEQKDVPKEEKGVPKEEERDEPKQVSSQQKKE